MQDYEILELFLNRQEAAVTEAKLKYGQRLFRTAMNILRNNEDAEECVNDTLLKTWEAIPPACPESLGAFMAKIARNLSINRWESTRAAKRGGGTVTLLLSELEECVPGTGGPEEEFEASLVTEEINTFLGALEQTARIAFTLRYFHGESIRAISERFGVSESKVKSILFRARKKLGVHLAKEGVVI